MKRGRRGVCQILTYAQDVTFIYPESIMHLLRDCEEVHEFWSKYFKPYLWNKIFSLSQEAWIDWNMSSKNIGLVHWSRKLVFGVVI